jgi:hypothetical protein
MSLLELERIQQISDCRFEISDLPSADQLALRTEN